jgi:hypothetical protein
MPTLKETDTETTRLRGLEGPETPIADESGRHTTAGVRHHENRPAVCGMSLHDDAALIRNGLNGVCDEIREDCADLFWVHRDLGRGFNAGFQDDLGRKVRLKITEPRLYGGGQARSHWAR